MLTAVKSVEDLAAKQAEIDSPLRLGYDWVDLCETKYFCKYQQSRKILSFAISVTMLDESWQNIC